MKERVIRVLMFVAILFTIVFTIGVYIEIERPREAGIAFGIGLATVGIVSAIQYILLGEWHPMYLFRSNKSD